jgi:hypothetical protein
MLTDFCQKRSAQLHSRWRKCLKPTEYNKVRYVTLPSFSLGFLSNKPRRYQRQVWWKVSWGHFHQGKQNLILMSDFCCKLKREVPLVLYTCGNQVEWDAQNIKCIYVYFIFLLHSVTQDISRKNFVLLYVSFHMSNIVIPVQAVEALRVARGWGSHIFRHSAQ